MASIVVKDDQSNSFAPITPAKTLNCALNSAITYCDDSGIIQTETATILNELSPNFGEFGPNSSNSTVIGGDVQSNRSEALLRCPLLVEGCYCSTLTSEDVTRGCADQCGAPPNAEKKDEKATLANQKSKKRKVATESNRKPGEKRQNKYYWPKIDVPKPPKTPKVVTPKPPRAKIPKTPKPKTPKVVIPKLTTNSKISEQTTNSKISEQNSKISEQVEEELIKETTRKRSLNFDVATTVDLKLDFSSTKPECNVSNDVGGNLSKNTTEVVTCTQGLNPLDGDDDVKPNKTIKEKNLIVYHRKFNSKCLYRCRKLVPNFQMNFKKKRVQRNKKSFGELKKFEEFSGRCFNEDMLDRILRVKGKQRMMLPTKVDLSQDFFRCVLSFLSSRPIFMKKKRLPRARRSTRQIVDEDDPIPSVICLPSLAHEPLKDETNGKEHANELQLHTEQQPRVDIDTLALSISKGQGRRRSKTGVVKEKNSRRPYKRKGKKEDCLSKLQDWAGASVANIMDELARRFGSLKLSDDPSTWLVEVIDQDYNTDDINEKIKLEEEKANLYEKIVKFITGMFYYQGSKKFIKWNGSVLDSVVGVFLTQNVTDVLSSTAFMNVVSEYPNELLTNSYIGVEHESEATSSQGSSDSPQKVIVEHPDDEEETTPDTVEDETMTKDQSGDEITAEDETMTKDQSGEITAEDEKNKSKESAEDEKNKSKEFDVAVGEMLTALPYLIECKKRGKPTEGLINTIDWEQIRVRFLKKSPRTPESQDSVDWEAVRNANVLDIAKVIERRGQQHIIAGKIQKMLNRLVKDHGSLDLEWLRDAPPQVAKAYLLSFFGLGLKSVECLRLLTLHHDGFPVDVNISRIAVRLGWVPITLRPDQPFHLLQKYPLEDAIQKYLWQRLSHLKQETLYTLHYQMITFGKVFCHKRNPNCRACPFKADCKHYASLVKSQSLVLPWPKNQKTKKNEKIPNPFDRVVKRRSSLLCLTSNVASFPEICVSSCNVGSSSRPSTIFDNVSQISGYSVDVPPSPKPEVEEVEEDVRNAEQVDLVDIEDCCDEYMYHLKLNTEKTSPDYCLEYNTSSLNPESREIVSVSPNAANNPLPKQVKVSRLRTEHQVYELPKVNPFLDRLNLPMQMGDVPYLLAIWLQDQDKRCDNIENCPCSSGEGECPSREEPLTIPGTLLLPVQTTLEFKFPLNGTYFQTNEVFADSETSARPYDVPTKWIWNLKKRTLYCGTCTSSIARGTTEDEIRQCCRNGFVCTRAYNRQTRAPEDLPDMFHYRPKAKPKQDNEEGKPKQDNKSRKPKTR
ncbi:hypothetical protein RND81_09G104600 [Saponaria officinalis]|uniref:Demeter RRM-fold domain-containing protein n=1 Tax=Saponaria officinalis TaxID=3572 RepID=A0AAW1IJA2_SAPOF